MLANITEAMRRGDHAAALQAARAVVADQPQFAAAHHLLGVCLQRQGDAAGARAAFEQAIALSPDQAAFHFSLGSLLLSLGQADAGELSLRQSLALDPNQLGAYVLLIHRALARKDLGEAERNLRLAQRVNAEHPQVRVAEGYVAQARGDADLAMKCFTAAATADPSLAAAQLGLGMAFLGRQMWPFAEQALSNALALDPSRPAGTLRALVEARRRQGKAEPTLAALDELIALQPADPVARSLRADILASLDRGGEALADLRWMLDLQPTNAQLLDAACRLLVREGALDEALSRAEAALALAPRNDDLWRIRLQLSGMTGEDAKGLLDRWQDANPDSADCLEMLAEYHQAQGESALAEAYADRALALEPLRHRSTMVKISAEITEEPEQALARATQLLAATEDAEGQRGLLGWAGMAQDSLGRYTEAAAYWREMLRRVPAGVVPPPLLLPANQAPEGSIDGTLLWSPVGVRAEFILQNLKQAMGQRLRLDRINSMGGGDGFGLVRFQPGHAEAGSADRWRQSLQAVGLDPATVVDWLPHVDGYTLAALRGARVLALLTDPRDALLNWAVHGCLQDYMVSPELEQAADWLAGGLEALADHHDAHPDLVVLARLDLDAASAGAAIETTLGVTEPLPALFGSGPRFAPGHWRHYREAFGAEFDRLAPVAVRLGYPLS